MAILDFTKATASVDMTNANLVTHKTPGATLPTDYYYRTPDDSSVHFSGVGMTYDADGRISGGSVGKVEIDTGAYNATKPEITITDIAVDATLLASSYFNFWRILEGNDVIIGPSQANAGPEASFIMFGDGTEAREGLSQGGFDIIQFGDAQGSVYGDVADVGDNTAGELTADYRGGADDIAGSATTLYQVLVGDADIVRASGRLTGGNDTIYIRSTHDQSAAFGDATFVQGVAGDIAELIGGNDYIEAGLDFRGTLVGDAAVVQKFAIARGGSDRIEGGGVREHIFGDARYVSGGQLIGGADRLSGNDGDDYIAGDAERVEAGGKLIGGNDTIYGGNGDDRIDGEAGFFQLPSSMSGGNDLLFGQAGDDVLDGQTGNDQLYGGADVDTLYGWAGSDFLDGGTGMDRMAGGADADTYVVDNAADMLTEYAGEGTDTVLSLLSTYKLGDNFENLTSLATGNFIGIGNGLANRIETGAGIDAIAGRGGNDVLVSGSGADQLHGEDGNDRLNGGDAGDRMEGGAGFDTVSYESADAGVRMSLDGSLVATGDALGDSLLGIEGLAGSSFNDVLRGDANANVLTGGMGTDVLQGMAGNDVIRGGAGVDTVVGGLGNDSFDFLALTDAIDRIADFSNAAGNNDTLRFLGSTFGNLTKGALSANHFVANTTGVAADADDRFIYETDTGILRYDSNGSAAGGITVVAVLTGAPTLTAADFYIL
ncbi:MAG: calcium-binding protein [Aestuariivirga sp.]